MTRYLVGLSALIMVSAGNAATVSAQDTTQRPVPSADIARAAKTARSVSDFNALTVKSCGTEPWQVTFAADGPTGIRIQRSPTMSRPQVGCILALIAQSKFRLTNGRNDR